MSVRSAENHRGYLAVIGGMSIHLMIGSFYLWGSLSTYIVAYFRKLDNPNLTYDQAAILFPVSSCMNCIFNNIGLICSSKFGSRKATFVFSMLTVLSVYFSSLANNFWVFFIFYGVIQGGLAGCLYMTPIRIAVRYFPHKKGTVSGLIVSSYALATFIINFMVTAVINPDNIKPQKING
jgi:MFS family permease